MFLRLYASLLLSMVVASLISWGFYHWQYDKRETQHIHDVLSGSFHLIAQGIERHSGKKRQQWQQVAQRLLGSAITIEELSDIEPGFHVESEDDNPNKILVYRGERIQLRSEIESINEQHYRLMASLLNNELGRLQKQAKKSKQSTDDLVKKLNGYYQADIQLVPLKDTVLDAQQMSRLKRFDIVVNDDANTNATSVYKRLNKSKQVLTIGPIEQFVAIPNSVVMVIVLLAIFFTGSTSYWLIKKLERRIASVEKGVSDFSKDPVHLTLQENNEDAIGSLAHSVNGMSQRIHQLLSDQKQLLQAISHEIRTPVSRLKFRTEMLSEQNLNEAGEKAVAGLKNDANEINDLVSEVVRFNQGSTQIHITEFSVLPLIQSILEKLSIDYGQVDVDYKEHDEILVKQDETLLGRVLQNLIQNACKYGNNQVAIKVETLGKFVRFTIEDNGPGIEAKDRQSIFSPFTRIESSRNKQTGGMGLGLAIVHNICESLSYYIAISDSPLGGAQFLLTIPVEHKEK